MGFTISTTPPNGTSWLGVSPSGNSTPAALTVFASAVGQSPGLYSGSIQIKPNNGSAAVTIPITFTVNPPSLAVDTTPISLTAQPGSSTCSQKSLAVQSSDSTTAVAFQGSASVSTPSGGSWLLLTPNSGTTPATLTVTCTAAGLSAGSYSGTVSLAVQNSISTPLSIPVALTVSGSPPAATVATISHVADGGGWTTTIVLVNTDSVPAAFTLKLFGDDGNPLVTSLTGLGITGTATDTIPVGGSRTIHTDGLPANLLTGWAQVSSSQSVNGTAIFRLQTAGQEAAVPLLTAGSQHLMFPFDNNSGLATGVALAASGAARNVPVSYTLRGQAGQTISLEPPVSVAANGHTSFVLPVRSSAAQDLRGVAQFDSQGGPIFGLGIRSNQGAFTSVEAVVQASPSVKTISHIADSGGWKTTIILVNTDTVPAVFTINFWRDDGTPFAVSLVGAGAQSTVTGTIQPGGTQTIETSNSGGQVITGWAEVLSSQSLGGTAIFASGGQEAAVPLLSSGSARLVLPFDNSGSLALGVALANPSATQDTTVSVTLRNENGVVISNEPSISLPRHSHTSFVLPVRSTNPQDLRGVVEFDSSNGNIYVLGIRGNNGAFTSVRALSK